MKQQIEKERQEFDELLLQNPNYFGTEPDLEFAAEMPMQGNTKYEELNCLGFYPEEDLLEAVLDVKLPYGYSGDLCSQGSVEYVRFYVDWDGDDDFGDPDEDVGMVCVNVHDIPNEDGICRDESKPLSYALKLRIDPEKRVCWKPYLVKVRAILEWRRQPPPETPNHAPIWGNVLESWVQIEPRAHTLGDLIDVIDLSKVKIESSKIFDLQAPIANRIAYSVDELQDAYREKDVPDHRLYAKQLAPVVTLVKNQPSLLHKYEQDPTFANKMKAIKALLYGKPEVKYEELTCLGLNYSEDVLEAAIKVKLPYGYMGDKCSEGSHEHVAFWLRIYDSIEQQCRWHYLGTSSVNVHDIEEIPDEGLHYAVYLQTDLSDWKDVCKNPVVMQLRGVLSWNERPSDTNPYWEPRWGNVKDTLIQLKPGGNGSGMPQPVIWSVGDVVVENISGNPFTIIPSAIGPGYANGDRVGGGTHALESPFGGKTKITGVILNAPDDPADVDKLRYKVQYRKSGFGNPWRDCDNSFWIWLRINGMPGLDPEWQTAAGGYYTYHRDIIPSDTVEVQDNVLAQWKTTQTDDGLYQLRVLVAFAAAPPVVGVPAGHIASNVIYVRIDNTKPKVEIDLDDDSCTKFEVGDSFTGTFTATDTHFYTYSIKIEPDTDVAPTVVPTSGSYPVITGEPSGSFTVTTREDATPCGYVIRLTVYDRTIVSNHFPVQHDVATVGLCLLEETGE